MTWHFALDEYKRLHRLSIDMPVYVREGSAIPAVYDNVLIISTGWYQGYARYSAAVLFAEILKGNIQLHEETLPIHWGMLNARMEYFNAGTWIPKSTGVWSNS